MFPQPEQERIKCVNRKDRKWKIEKVILILHLSSSSTHFLHPRHEWWLIYSFSVNILNIIYIFWWSFCIHLHVSFRWFIKNFLMNSQNETKKISSSLLWNEIISRNCFKKKMEMMWLKRKLKRSWKMQNDNHRMFN